MPGDRLGEITDRWLKLTIFIHNATEHFNSDMSAYMMAMHTLGLPHDRYTHFMVSDQNQERTEGWPMVDRAYSMARREANGSKPAACHRNAAQLLSSGTPTLLHYCHFYRYFDAPRYKAGHRGTYVWSKCESDGSYEAREARGVHGGARQPRCSETLCSA